MPPSPPAQEPAIPALSCACKDSSWSVGTYGGLNNTMSTQRRSRVNSGIKRSHVIGLRGTYTTVKFPEDWEWEETTLFCFPVAEVQTEARWLMSVQR